MNLQQCILFLGLLSASALSAQPDSDPVVLMDRLGYNYSFTEAGNIRTVFEVGKDDRTQLVIVKTKTQTYLGTEIREVLSIAGQFKKAKREVLIRLLEDSGRKKLGSWSIEFDEEAKTYVVFFTAKIPATVDEETLKAVLLLVSESADEMEQALMKGDDY